MNSDALTEDAQAPARRYINLLPGLMRAEQEVDRIKKDLIQTQNEIGAKLAPPDAKFGESFHLWVRWPRESKSEVLLKVACIGEGVPTDNPPKPKLFSVAIRWPRS